MIKQEQIGKHELTVVEFGTGDLGLVEIQEQGMVGRTLLIAQDLPKPIEEWEKIPSVFEGATNSDDLEWAVKPIVLRFTKSVSISQLIKSLQDLYDSLNLEENK